MTDINFLLNKANPNFLTAMIAENFQKLRISQNLTQSNLAERSGVSLSSLKRFEQKAEISLSSLLKLAISLEATEAFGNLFSETKINSIDDFLDKKKKNERKRVRR